MRPVSVTQLNNLIKRILQTDPLLSGVTVSGEISNLKYHSSGHVYFTLKDETSRIQCFLPAEAARRLRYELTDGLESVIDGYIAVYEKGGSYSLNVREINIEGTGGLSTAFRLLTERLTREGLFDQSQKPPVPEFPKIIALVTSPTGAAIQDMLRILTERNPLVNLRIFPCLVQGKEAADDISTMLDLINQKFPDTELILLGRGGGSLEDLWAFNEEPVARAIARSTIPVISAIGHEQDVTIADYAATARVATPTHAAEMAVPDLTALKLTIQNDRQRLIRQIHRLLDFFRLKLDRADPAVQTTRFNARLKRQELRVEQGFWQLRRSVARHLITLETSYRQASGRLLSADPNHLLTRGYAGLRNRQNEPVTGVAGLNPGDSLTLILRDGKIRCLIQEIWRTSDGSKNRTDL